MLRSQAALMQAIEGVPQEEIPNTIRTYWKMEDFKEPPPHEEAIRLLVFLELMVLCGVKANIICGKSDVISAFCSEDLKTWLISYAQSSGYNLKICPIEGVLPCLLIELEALCEF